MAAVPEPTGEVNLAEVRKLLELVERDLEHVNDDTAALQRLRDEVQTLKNVLDSPVHRHNWIRDSLHGMREAIDSAGAATASRYVAEIGRILGM